MAEKIERFESLKKLFAMSREQAEKEFSPYFYTYFSGYFKDSGKLDRKVREMTKLMKRLQLESGVLLDVGCGFGLEAVVLALLLPPEVRVLGVDHNEEKILLARKLAELAGAGNMEFILEKGDDRDGAMAADVVVCRHMVSHVNDVEEFLSAMAGNLKPGGCLYIIDDRNALSPLTVWMTRKYQKQAESGRQETDRLRANDTGLNFFETRKKMIREEMELDEQTILRYAALTAGLYGAQVVGFARALHEGKRPQPPSFKYVNPLTGECYERLFNPYTIKRLLRSLGMKASVERPFMGFSIHDRGLKKWIGIAIETLHPLSLFFAPIYHIKAIKQK
jgi:2-polyprenyl-3-methyl-5-hydroxy-6-metoxy-1,4-benzoquinol methylase